MSKLIVLTVNVKPFWPHGLNSELVPKLKSFDVYPECTSYTQTPYCLDMEGNGRYFVSSFGVGVLVLFVGDFCDFVGRGFVS